MNHNFVYNCYHFVAKYTKMAYKRFSHRWSTSRQTRNSGAGGREIKARPTGGWPGIIDYWEQKIDSLRFT